jgi:hypothetical protein
MSSAAVLPLIRDRWPRPPARLMGIVSLLYFLTAIAAQLLTSRKLVALGNATNLLSIGWYPLLTLLFYNMFKPVNKAISTIAALSGLTGCVVMSLGLYYPDSVSLSPLLFFGPYCILIGYLVFRSTLLPRVLGVLMVLAGLGWLAFLASTVQLHLSVYIQGLGIFAEAALMLWLMIVGVNAQRWKDQSVNGRKPQ